jgi:universal stress protein E
MSWHQIMLAGIPDAWRAETLDKAVQLASALDAELELFQCVFEPGVARSGRFTPRRVSSVIRSIVERAHQKLDAQADQLRSRGVRVRSSVRWDHPPAEGIVRQVLRQQPDLLMIESKRPRSSARWMGRRTDFRLIETCPCPLLLIKSPERYGRGCTIAAVDPLHVHDKPAVLDDTVLDTAAVVSHALACERRVFHAYAPWPQRASELAELHGAPEEVYADACAAYLRQVEAGVRDLARRHGIPDSHLHAQEGVAPALLPQLARSSAANIVVMGAVARSLWKRTWVGHTAERVLDALDCDLLVVKPPGFRAAVSRQSVHRIDRAQALPGRYIW